jgi:quinol monooxygenase YgiN
MDGKAIQVTVFSFKLGFEDSLLSELAPIIEATRQISGCLSFDLYRLSKDRTTLVLQETWETQEVQYAYVLSPIKAELMSLLAQSVAQPIQVWEVEELC